jgi:hypothetical protein
MPKYYVDQPLRHDGEDYAIGTEVEMTERAAAPLVDAAVIVSGSVAKARAAAEKAAEKAATQAAEETGEGERV